MYDPVVLGLSGKIQPNIHFYFVIELLAAFYY